MFLIHYKVCPRMILPRTSELKHGPCTACKEGGRLAGVSDFQGDVRLGWQSVAARKEREQEREEERRVRGRG